MRRRRVLVFTDWYLPGYLAGGPVRSVANLIRHLGRDFEFMIVTSDRDLRAHHPYPGIATDTWQARDDGSWLYYVSERRRSFRTIRELMTSSGADVVYLNSLFSRVFTIYPLLVRLLDPGFPPVVLAPRGMLGPGALKIKQIRKRAFLHLARLVGLYRDITWHASTAMEAREIRAAFGPGAIVREARNLSDTSQIRSLWREKQPGRLRAVFLSRVHRKKNLLGALKAMAQVPAEVQVEFDVFGPIEDPGHWRQCQRVIGKLPSHVVVTYRGSVESMRVAETLSNYHLSVLMTQHESFGHSILESLASGCLQLLSDQTPWSGVAERELGWVVPLNDCAAAVAALQECCLLDQAEYNRRSSAAVAYAADVINDQDEVENSRRLFRK